ncbi:MAG: glycosyltransferase family 2 protein [Desulfovibrio sp.]|nr:glycosyltransferase family 2 protein [Desulfovibrio sp.]
MRVHIGIVTWNRLNLTRQCLPSLLAHTPPGYTLTVVDNGSTDGTPRYLTELAEAHPHLRLRLLNRNMGVAVASNLAWDDASSADYFVKLDNDVEIRDPHWLERLTHMLSADERLGMAGYRLCPWHEGTPLQLADNTPALSVMCCNGACACIPRAVHEKLGFWNEGYGRYGHEDLEYSWRARQAGYLLAYALEEDAVRHRGAEPERREPDLERGKLSSRTAVLSGTRTYLMYLLLFEGGVIPLKVGRKYLPVDGPDGLRFSLNPEHKALQRLLTRLVQTVETSQDGDLSGLDLSAWQKKGILS